MQSEAQTDFGRAMGLQGTSFIPPTERFWFLGLIASKRPNEKRGCFDDLT